MASESSSLPDLPLFPLSTVLFPGGELKLRVFEPRYLAMLSECTRTGSGFGVCLILSGREAGAPAVPTAVGTHAELVDFDRLPGGTLGIRVRGGKRFQVVSSRVRDDGLVRARVQFWQEEPRCVLPAEFGLLATVLERLIDQLGGTWRGVDQACFENAAWVGFRLAELLPLPARERQQLLELTDTEQRLAELRDLLPRFQKD